MPAVAGPGGRYGGDAMITTRRRNEARGSRRSARSGGEVALSCTMLLAALVGCTTSAGLSSGTEARTEARTAAVTTSTPPVTPELLCPNTGTARQDAPALVMCISTDVSDYWTAVVGQPIQDLIVVAPEPESVPGECQAFLSFGTAFYCGTDATVYITAALLDLYATTFGDGLPYALAGLVAHEIGHVVQDAFGQPGFDNPEGTDEQSQVTEQQADCLIGVWVADAARVGQLDPVTFRAIVEQELTILTQLPVPQGVGIDDYDQVATHGTIEQRMAAYEVGMAGGRGSACGLVGVP